MVILSLVKWSTRSKLKTIKAPKIFLSQLSANLVILPFLLLYYEMQGIDKNLPGTLAGIKTKSKELRNLISRQRLQESYSFEIDKMPS